jgi:hypothetical protein
MTPPAPEPKACSSRSIRLWWKPATGFISRLATRRSFARRSRPRRRTGRAVCGSFSSDAARPPRMWQLLGRRSTGCSARRPRLCGLKTRTPRMWFAPHAPKSSACRHCRTRSAHPAATGLVERARAALDSHTALLSFHLGDSVSWLWALDRDGLALYALPPRNRDRVSDPSRDCAPSAEIRPIPDRLAPICTALFSGRWLPGFDTGRAGCWRWTRGFSTFR